MKSGRFIYLCIILMSIVLLGGCGSSESGGKEEVTVTLFGFPSNHDTYYVSLYALTDNDQIKINRAEEVSSSDEYKKTINVRGGTKYLVAYLFEDPNYDPTYMYIFPYDSERSEYQTGYWMRFSSYRDGYIYFGLSKQMARPVSDVVSEEVDFDKHPYYLYKVEQPQNLSIGVELTNVEGPILFQFGTFKDRFDYSENFTVESDTLTGIDDNMTDDLYILLTPRDYQMTTKAQINIASNPKIAIDMEVQELVATDSPDLIYAIGTIEKDHYSPVATKLAYIDLVTRSKTREFALEDDLYPVAMTYSAIDQKLYILGGYSRKVAVWDLHTETYTTYSTPGGTIGRDMQADPIKRHLYIATHEGLSIVDMDNPEQILAQTESDDFNSMVVDSTNGKLYASYYSTLFRYNLDDLALEEKLKVPSAVKNGTLQFDQQQNRLYYMENNTIQARDAANLIELVGTWGLEFSADLLAVSPDGTTLYGVDQEYWNYSVNNGKVTYVYLFDSTMANSEPVKRFPFYNSGSYNVSNMTLNSDGSTLVGSSDEYLYFFTDIELESTSLETLINYQHFYDPQMVDLILTKGGIGNE